MLVALLGWVAIGARISRVPLVVGTVVAVGLVVAFPYTRFIGEPAKSDSFGLIPLWTANENLLGGSYRLTVLVIALLLAALVAIAREAGGGGAARPPRALRRALAPRLVGASRRPALRRGALFQGIRGVDRDWIDEWADGDVAVLWTGRADRFTVNLNEFFNRRVGPVFYTSAPTPGGFGEQPVRVDRNGIVRTADGGTVDLPYALLDGSVTPDGAALERDELGMTLWQLRGPLASLTKVGGVYPGDTWSGPIATWRRLRCTGGELRVRMHSDPTLFAGRLTHVLASSVGGRPVARITVPPEGSVTLPVPLTPSNGTCTVRFTVDPTLVPADVLPDSTDGRELGVHFDEFRCTRARVVVVDVSPLSHPPTGIGNYIRGSLAGMASAAAGAHELVAFAPTSLRGPVRIREALAGIPVQQRLIPLPASHALRTAWSRLGRPPVERLAGPLDAFVFSEWMHPKQRGGVRATVFHDLVPLHHRSGAPHARSRCRDEGAARGGDLRRRLRELPRLHRRRPGGDARDRR